MDDVQDYAAAAKGTIDQTVQDFQNNVATLEQQQATTPVTNVTVVESNVFNAQGPVWIDEVWADTVVVVGLTCFILCLMGLSKVRNNLCTFWRLTEKNSCRSASTASLRTDPLI